MCFLNTSIAALAAGACASAFAFPIATPGTEGFVVIAGGGDVVATYQGNSASYSNDLYLENTGAFLFNNHANSPGDSVDLGTFAAGTELVFRMHVNNTGYDYFTGPASRNPDGAAHGSGCTHSAVLAARLALGDTLLEAATVARRLAGEAVANGLRDVGAGAGPVDVIDLAAHRGSPHVP